MSLSLNRRLLASAFAVVLVGGAGCGGCGEDDLVKPKCASDADCLADPDFGEGWFCNLSSGKCEVDVHECGSGSESECCPGQICTDPALQCWDKWTPCDDDASCSVKGMHCQRPWGVRPTSAEEGETKGGCGYEKCGTGGACAEEGTACFNGWCVGGIPCRGGCKSGEVCTTVNDRCFKPLEANGWPMGSGGSCAATCAPGTILVFVDGTNVFNRCDKSQKECRCEPLPAVKANDTARFTAAADGGAKVLVSAYDTDHGDLVVHTFDKATFKREKTEWIDGVPTSGAITGDPEGPRSGRDAPGPDVGQHTSIAFDKANSTTHISYYAVKDAATPLGDLKYAKRSGTGAWKFHVVDGKSDAGTENGDTGLYSSLTLDAAGFPVIAYFQKGGVGADAFKTALRFARAKVREPERASDWTLTTVDTGIRTPPPCSNPVCVEAEVCTESTTTANGVCRTKAAKATDCKTSPTDASARACTSDEACVLNAALAPVCAASLRASTLAGLPEGNGLMPSVAYLEEKPVIVWYDRNARVLKGVIATSDSASAGAIFRAQDIKILDDGSRPDAPVGAVPHDVGQFPSLAIGPADAGSRIAVAYMDLSAHQLRVVTAKAAWADLTPAALRVVDNGKGEPGTDPTLFVGADTAIAFDAAKNLSVLYQDATQGDLRIAEQQAGGQTFTIRTLKPGGLAVGAAGFYNALLVDGSTRFAAHTLIKAASASQSANKVELFQVQ